MTGKASAKRSVARRDHIVESTSVLHATVPGRRTYKPDDLLVREFIWNINSINAYLESIRSNWAKALGITSPQWMILIAVRDMDQSKGVSVRDVSSRLHVDPSFVTTQSKKLEKHGFVRRINSKEDARVVLMSLTDKAHKQISSLYSRQADADNLVFADFSDQTLRDFIKNLSTLKERLAKAAQVIAVDL
jgi:DNA-binding MarR family transcriptional regulator